MYYKWKTLSYYTKNIYKYLFITERPLMNNSYSLLLWTYSIWHSTQQMNDPQQSVAVLRNWHNLARLLFPLGCQGDDSDEWQIIYHLHKSHSQPAEERLWIIQNCSNQGHTCWIWYYTPQFGSPQKTTLKYWNDNATPVVALYTSNGTQLL